MKKIDVLTVSLNITPLDLQGNRAKILETFRFVHDRDIPSSPPPKAKCVLFPEFPLCGHVGDLFAAPWFRNRVLSETLRLLPETRSIVAVISLPLEVKGVLYRAALVAVDGTPLGFVCDRNIPQSLLRWFSSWKKGVKTTIRIGNLDLPVGDITFEISGIRLGVSFDPFKAVETSPGLDLLLIPGADPFELEKGPRRRESIRLASEKGNCAVLFANLLGNESGQIIYDGESVVAETGRILALERRFSYQDVSHLTAVLDLDQIRQAKGDPHPPTESAIVCRDTFDWGWHSQRRYEPLGFYRESDSDLDLLEDWEKSGNLAYEEFPRAVAIGLYDYMRKSRSHGFVLSLSGGADSASIAVLVSLMVWFGFTSLGKRRFLEKLSFIDKIASLVKLHPSDVTPTSVVSTLLTTVYQQTANNSPITREAAKAVAEEVGAVHREFDIEDIVQRYISLASDAIGRPLSWQTDDLPMQNIQARVRGPAAWLLANLRGALLLSTGNRSEAACGYATMDGDTCGSISPIAGISKAFLRKWLEWLEVTGPILSPPLFSEDGLGERPFRVSYPSIRLINRQQPTAELRPLEAGQTDEADLMPYTALDIIERGFTSGLFGERLLHNVTEKLSGNHDLISVTSEQIQAWIAKFEQMFAKAQWKRSRLAPGFHIETEDLSPDFYRIPILSAGLHSWKEDQP
ncbi:MAG: NAD(+) synthase [Thermoguttaceae bacterium]|nr:NAD(+) synthase [Thermoguttaceae bacterium]